MRRIVLAVLLPLFVIQYVESAAVMSVDLGSEWIKVGIVSPGVPMEIVLNKESKRKSPAVVALRDGVRTFGEDAVAVGVRFPKYSYKFVLDLLGKPYDHPIVQLYMKRFPYYDIRKSAYRGTPCFVHDDVTTYTPEELIGQLLTKAKEYAEITAGQPINECVITIPGFFNQDERKAVLDAARLADLNVAQLMNDHAAIALNYGIFRRKEINETASHVLFFDMGAYSTKAALVEYKTVKIKEKGFVETVPQLQVIGFAYDRTLGGLELTLRLREHLAQAWEQGRAGKGGGDLRSSPRAMEKLLREAERVKNILSANTEHYAQIEGLIDDKDFKVQVTRAELESLCEELWERVGSVVERARAAAGGAGAGARMVVAGAGARVPRIAAVLRQLAGEEPSRGINADEAATLGAVYRAAAQAKGYRVAPILVRDAVVLPVQVTFSRVTESQQEKLVKRTLFGLMNPFPQKKVITFNKHTEDFSFYVNYAELDHLPESELAYIGSTNLTKVTLTGVAEVLAKNHGPNIEAKGIKTHFAMDDSGILNLVNVEFVAEKTVSADEDDEESSLSKLGSTISRLFSSDSTASAKPEGEGKPEEHEKEEQLDSEQNDTAKAVPTNDTAPPITENINQTEAEPKAAKPKIITLKEPIMADSEIISLTPITNELIIESEKKINELNVADRKRTERETALNSLESFVIEAQSKIDVEEFAECGTPEEIEAIRKACSEVSEWLDEDGYNADTEMYDEKLTELKKITEPLFIRLWEHRERPEAIEAYKSLLNNSQHFLEMAKNFTKEANPDKDVFTDVEIKVLTKTIDDTEKWYAKTLKEQDALKKHETVILTVDSLREKMYGIDREVKYLVSKLKLWKPKKPVKPIKEKTDKNKTDAEPGDIKIEELVLEDGKESAQNAENEEKIKSETVEEETEIPALADGSNDEKHSEL